MAAFNSFNSLQTGRYVESKDAARFHASFSKFQFPSNGKVRGKAGLEIAMRDVSNGFQFPSNGKVRGKKGNGIIVEGNLKFQFPSNGKGHGKSEREPTGFKTFSRFNSLQTGRDMESPHF